MKKVRPDNLFNELVKELQGDMPLVERPYQTIADKIGVTEEQVIEAVREMIAQGRLRRLGAVVRHRDAGYQANAMVAWKMAEDEIDRAGQIMAQSPAVSHCYWRKTTETWPYNLFCMVHAHNEEELRSTVAQLAEAVGNHDYQCLGSIKEFKKNSVRFRD